MTAVGQVKRAVAAAIKAAGCAAIESYSEEQLKRYATAVAAVGTKETVIEESGAAQYLGEKVDEATQETVSVYGRKMLLTLLIEVYAPRTLGAAGCEKAAEVVTQALMTALPEGLKLGSLQWGKTGWDKTTGMFRLDASAKYAAYFVAEAAEDETVFAAAAVAAVIAGNTDPPVPINGAELTLFGAAGKRLSDNEIDQLVRGGVTPIETVGGVSSPVRGITTKTSSGGAADTTWRELTTILIVDEVIPTIRSALRTRFARSKNTAQSRGAIRSQVVLELEEMKSREIVDSYGEVLVSALKSDPTVCLVEFSFTVAHGLNRIYLTAHITV